MLRNIRAAAYSGTASLGVVLLFMAFGSIDEFPPSGETIFAVAALSSVIWLLGFIVAFLLLIPLAFIYNYLNRWVSLVLFLSVGAVVPMYLEFVMMHIPVHGEPSVIETQTSFNIAVQLLQFGLLGAVSATAAWFALESWVPENAA